MTQSECAFEIRQRARRLKRCKSVSAAYLESLEFYAAGTQDRAAIAMLETYGKPIRMPRQTELMAGQQGFNSL